jgi:hypothetical protein
MSLTLDLRRIAKARKQSIQKVYRGTMFSMGARVIEMSPVKLGRFQGNWFPGIGSENLSTDISSEGKQASTTRLLSGIGSLTTSDDFYFMNNLPYAKKLEDGSSTQAKNGMVKVTVNDFAQILEVEIRNLDK